MTTSEEAQQQLAKLIARRGGIQSHKGMTTKLKKYFDNFDTVQNIQQFKVRLNNIIWPHKYSSFEKLIRLLFTF